VTRERLLQALAIVQGADLEALLARPSETVKEPVGEQPSFGQLADARALRTRDLDLREQSLRSNLQLLQTQQRQVTDDKKKLRKVKDGFEVELVSLQKGAAATGREDVRRTLESLKPKQAKEQLLLMLEKKEIDDVVMLVGGMAENKRAKVIAEFKTPAESEQISEVLRRIRQGMPTTEKVDETQKTLEPPKGPGT
jgi:hypothetical protein